MDSNSLIHISDILVFPIHFYTINFLFQVFTLFIFQNPASFSSDVGHIFQIISCGGFMAERAIHCWGPVFATRSLDVAFVVDESESEQIFVGDSPIFLGYKYNSSDLSYSHLIHIFHFMSPDGDAAGLVNRH